MNAREPLDALRAYKYAHGLPMSSSALRGTPGADLLVSLERESRPQDVTMLRFEVYRMAGLPPDLAGPEVDRLQPYLTRAFLLGWAVAPGAGSLPG